MIIAPESEFVELSHCGYCGDKFVEQRKFPRKCFRCSNDTYKNPVPVVVALVPVFNDDPNCNGGWLVEQRGINPGKGLWALPSGYMEFGETWEESIVREMQEEVGLTTTVEEYSLYKVCNSSQSNILIFCVHHGVHKSEIKFTPNEEVLAIDFPLTPYDMTLCFTIQNQVWREYCLSIW